MTREEFDEILEQTNAVICNREWYERAIKALEQESTDKENLVVEDCISRAELLKAVDTWDKFGCDADTKLVPVKDCYVPYIHYDDVVKAIKGMPSVQPKTEWIPVSERLPENHDCVLVWFEYIKDDWDCAWWGLAYYSLQNKKWFVSTNERNPIVKAWMPLPEPYELADSEKE